MKKVKIIFFILLPLAAVFSGLFAGRYPISLSDVLGSLAQFVQTIPQRFSDGAGPFAERFTGSLASGVSEGAQGNGAGISSEIYTVVTELRLPRLIAAAFVGAALSASEIGRAHV